MAEFQPLTPDAYETVLARGRAARRVRAVSARYDRGRGRVVLRLETGLELGFSPHDAQGLDGAAAVDLADVQVTGAGTGVHFPRLDVGFSVEGLLDGRLGSEAWMATRSRRVA